MVEEDIIFPILPRRIEASAQRRYPNEEPDEAKLFYRRPTHVLRHSTSSAGSSSSNSALHISKKKGDVSRSGVQSTSSRRASVPFQSILAQDPSESIHSSNLPMTGSSGSLSSTSSPRRMATSRDKPLPPPPSFRNDLFNNFEAFPDAPNRASLAQPGQTSSHSGDIWRVSGITSFKSMQSIRPTSAQTTQRSGSDVHSMAFAMIGRRPKSARESRPSKREWVDTAVPPKQPFSSKVPRSQLIEPVTRHEHAVLEVLFKSVFEGRFINTSPTAILPSYLNTYFKNLIASPRVDMPTPPAPERRIKDIFETEDVNTVSLKPALKSPLRPAVAIMNRYPAPQTYQRSRLLSRSASIPLDPSEVLSRPQHPSASSESEESDRAYWSARSLVTPTTPPGQSKGIELVKEEENSGENDKATPALSLLTKFDEEDDARGAITSPTTNWAQHPLETETAQENEAPMTLDAALAAIERHDQFYNEPLSALRWSSVDIGSLKSTYQRKQPRYAEKYVCQSHTRVKARESAGSALCLVLPRALFKLDERDMGLHLRKTYMSEFQRVFPDAFESTRLTFNIKVSSLVEKPCGRNCNAEPRLSLANVGYLTEQRCWIGSSGHLRNA